MGRRHRALGRGASQTEVRQPALLYVARHQEDRVSPDIITSAFLIFDVPYLALIDIGSTHSYIASNASENLGILVESTISEDIILSLLGQFVQVRKLYRDVPLVVQGTIFLVDLMELLFGEFDIVLVMGWLVKHRVSLDCATKRAVLRTEEDEEVILIRERWDYLSNVISVLVVEKLVRKGCEVYLAYVSVSGSGDSFVGDIRTVRDFSDVFPEELPRLPPSREVKFGIELLPGTTPMSITLYRMTPKELAKLKAQLQELLDRGFICPSVSTGEHRLNLERSL
ncbi:uncharacterized protein [Gossypium hirsutum]|uniref:DNA/RNA polymerases superfamily protein n=1 Tax=Gossypium hirsutum TaxID=3635 RepID=A0A1U8KMK3_GOSHI|nr:uncharacterized protein LOC107917387 [Gossypium hirsutum]